MGTAATPGQSPSAATTSAAPSNSVGSAAAPAVQSPIKAPLGPPNETVQSLLDLADSNVDANDLESAIKAFRAAYAIEPRVDIACNRGLVAGELKLPLEAAEYLAICTQRFRVALPEDQNERRWAIGLLSRLALAKSELGTLMVRLEGAKTADLSVDGKSVGRIGVEREVFVTPGSHEIAVSEGSARAARHVDMTAGSNTTLALDLTSTPAPLAPIPARVPEPRPKPLAMRRDPRFIAGGIVATTIGVALGFVFLGVSHGYTTDADDSRKIIKARTPTECFFPEEDLECQNVGRYADSADAFRNYSIASFIGGGLSGVATVVFSLAPGEPFVRAVPTNSSGVMIGGWRW